MKEINLFENANITDIGHEHVLPLLGYVTVVLWHCKFTAVCQDL
jgi:hypothetical protein